MKNNMHATFVTHLSFPCHGSHPFEAQLTEEQLFSLGAIPVGRYTNIQNRGIIL